MALSFAEVSTALQKAIGAQSEQRVKVEAARVAAKQAEQSYAQAVQAVRDLHQEYQKIIQDVLTDGGRIHA